MGLRLAVILGGLAACTAAPEYGSVEQGLRCDPEFCGTNSQLMAHYGTWEFNVTGQMNGQGFRVLGLGKGTDFYQLVVQGSFIYGLDVYGNVALADQDLVGARIYLDYRRRRQSAIEITAVGNITEMVNPNDPLGTYVLDWANVIANPLPGPMRAGDIIESGNVPELDTLEPVCPPPQWLEESYAGAVHEWEETTYWGLLPFHSVVFEGDRFDPYTRTVSPVADDDWFNIGCGAHTLAKLRLTRNTIHTSPDWQRVQAALKMLGADYCGGGTSFTFPGEPLVWRDGVAMDYLRLGPGNELEARWNENGATCIHSPRLVNTGNPAAAKAFPDVWQAIQDECNFRVYTLDKCNTDDPVQWDGELVTSANYD